jgi:hypothetical protein
VGKEDREAAASRAFYSRMKADHYRYQSEFEVGAERRAAAGNALAAYKEAAAEAHASLEHTDPLRLGIALNFVRHSV